MKKISILFLTIGIVFIAAMLSSCGTDEPDYNEHDYFEVGTLNYKKIDKKSVAVTSGKAAGSEYVGDIVIPSSVSYDGRDYSVISIDDSAFYGDDKVMSIVIPSSVTSIGDCAFAGCRGLKSVEIPASVTFIGRGAFTGCINLRSFSGKYASEDHRCLIVDGVLNSFAPADLTEYSIPKSVKSIGYHAFEYAWDLEYIEIPNSVTSIGAFAFFACEFTNIELPESLTKIDDYAFCACSYLTTITIPNSVNNIGIAPFLACRDLRSFYGKYASEDHRCLIVNGTLNSVAQEGLRYYSIPSSVKSIGQEAFKGADVISIVIPASVTSIGDDAFSMCSKVSTITIENSNPKNIKMGDRVFAGGVDFASCVLIVPKGSVELYKAAAQWNEFENIVEI